MKALDEADEREREVEDDVRERRSARMFGQDVEEHDPRSGDPERPSRLDIRQRSLLEHGAPDDPGVSAP